MGDVEKFLQDLNKQLCAYDVMLRGDSTTFKHPVYFVIGAPKSGTTLLTQVLAQCMDLRYICNLAARFWRAPLVGVKLAHATLGEYRIPSFESRNGQTVEPDNVHEFGRFWQEQFLYWRQCHVGSVDERLTARVLSALQLELGGPMVMKGIYPAHVPDAMQRILGDNLVWVWVDRDPVDACMSILDAQRAQGDAPFGWQIPGRVPGDEYSTHGMHEHILCQVQWWRRRCSELAHVVIDLRDFCQTPYATLYGAFGSGEIKRRTPENAVRKYVHRYGHVEDRFKFEDLQVRIL